MSLLEAIASLVVTISLSHSVTQSLRFDQIYPLSNPRITLDAFGLQAPTQTFHRHIREILTLVKVKNVKITFFSNINSLSKRYSQFI